MRRRIYAAVVLAAEVSRSIDDGEFVLERPGYAQAIQSRKLLDAISTGAHGASRWHTWNGSEKANRRSSTVRSAGMRRDYSPE